MVIKLVKPSKFSFKNKKRLKPSQCLHIFDSKVCEILSTLMLLDSSISMGKEWGKNELAWYSDNACFMSSGAWCPPNPGKSRPKQKLLLVLYTL